MKILRVVILVLFPAMSFGAPGVKIKNDTFNFGKVLQNTTLTHAYWIKSTGDDTLLITEVVPGCGCTQMPLLDSTVAPGDSTRLDIIFTTRSFIGNVNKRPYVMTNASTDKVGMSIYAEVLVDPETGLPLVLRPARLDVSQFTAQPRRRAIFQIVNKSSEDLLLQVIDSSFKSFEVILPSKIKAGTTAEGTVIVKKTDIARAFKESFTFEAVGTESRDLFTLPVERMYNVKDTAGSSVSGSR
jgi:hypothetical protein